MPAQMSNAQIGGTGQRVEQHNPNTQLKLDAMYISFNFLGRTLCLELSLTRDEDEALDGITGGAGGNFELFADQALEYFEGDDEWEESYLGFGFGKAFPPNFAQKSPILPKPKPHA